MGNSYRVALDPYRSTSTNERLKFSGKVADKCAMEKTLDEKIAELTAELTQVKGRLDKCEQQLAKHQTAIERDIPEQIKNHPGYLT